MTSVLFYAGEPVVRRGLLELLRELRAFDPIGQAVSGEQLLEFGRTAPWDVAIVYLREAHENTLELLARFGQACPGVPVIAVSFALDPASLRNCLDLAVAGLLASENIPDELGDAVQSVLNGAPYFSRMVVEALKGDSCL